MSIDTPFSLVDGCLFAQLVDLFDKGLALGSNGDYSKSYEQIWSDMRKCVDRCHKDGAIKLTVAEGATIDIHFLIHTRTSTYVHLHVNFNCINVYTSYSLY